MEILIHSQYENGDFIYNHITKKNHSRDDYSPHFHDVYELVFVKSGAVSYIVDGRKYALCPDSLVISRPGDIHCICIEDTKCEYERYNILFSEKSLSSRVYEKIPKNVNVIDFNRGNTVKAIFSKMEYYSKALEKEELKSILPSLTEEVLFNVLIELSDSGNASYTELDSTMQRAVRYIDDNLFTITDLEEICNNVYVTKSHLHHLFIKHLKITPKKYILAKRLAFARREIHMGAKVTDLYSKCGFSDYSSFFRAYKSHFGTSPSKTDKSDVITTEKNDFRRRYNT